MVTLDQVLLLEKKVENAVQKIEQLRAENDALRSRCAELTNALSAKTEQFSSFESDQNKIEAGILSALSRLSEMENSIVDISESDSGAEVRKASGGVPPDGGAEWRDAATGQTEASAPFGSSPFDGDEAASGAEASAQDGLFAEDAPPSSGEGADGHSPEEVPGSAVPSEDAPVDSPSNPNPFDIF